MNAAVRLVKTSTAGRVDSALAPVCFRPPLAVINNSEFNPFSEAAVLVGNGPASALAGLRGAQVEALAHLVPCLMCGEESAVHVFFHAGRRRDNATSVGRELLWQIAAEEAVHEAMLSHLRSQLPIPPRFAEIRERSRQFFLRMSCTDAVTKFAQIAALDSAVCKIMAALCGRRAHIKSCQVVHRIATKIRSDEARHVHISRQYIADLGLPASSFRDFNQSMGSELVGLLFPIGAAFEELGVDPDLLFSHIKCEEQQ